jgi:hypothetical protein
MITNDEVAAAVRAHPRHVVGVASVDISRPMAGVRELRRCVIIRLGSLVTAYVRREVLLQLLGLRRSGKGYHHV